MADIVLNIELRERTGKSGARAARAEALVPGVIYGGALAPVSVSVGAKEFRKALHTGKLLGHLVKLQHGAETQSVIAKAIQFHPVTDEPLHFDLYRVDAHQEIRIAVPLHFSHQDISPGIKRGGTLNIVVHDVEVRAHADSIPEEIVADLSALDIGDVVRVSDLQLPKGVEAVAEADFVVATITGASLLEGGEGGEPVEGDAEA